METYIMAYYKYKFLNPNDTKKTTQITSYLLLPTVQGTSFLRWEDQSDDFAIYLDKVKKNFENHYQDKVWTSSMTKCTAELRIMAAYSSIKNLSKSKNRQSKVQNRLVRLHTIIDSAIRYLNQMDVLERIKKNNSELEGFFE